MRENTSMPAKETTYGPRLSSFVSHTHPVPYSPLKLARDPCSTHPTHHHSGLELKDMAEIKAADKAEKKSGRRSSFMALAKRVKQFEQGRGDKQASIPAVKRQDYIIDELSKRSSSPKPAAISADNYDLDPGPQSQTQEYTGGAEIPDIPLHRNTRTINSGDLDLDTLAALERILTAGNPQGMQQHAVPQQNRSASPYKIRADNRYDDQCVDLDQDFKGEGRLLYPVSECSTEWESNSLSDVPEGGESPEPSLRHESLSSANYGTQLSPRIGAHVQARSPSNASVELPIAPPRGTAPFQSGLQPKVIPPSLTTDHTSQTETSIQTNRAMTPTLPALQAKGVDDLEDGLQPVDDDDMEPGSFDLIVPTRPVGVYSLERRSELLFSTDHLRVIFADPIFLNRFTSFVAMYRPTSSTALVNYALEAVKAIRAMEWMNDIISKSLRPEGKPQHSFFTGALPDLTVNESLRRKAAAAMEAIARDELPAYVTHVWTDIVEVSMKRKITGSMPAHLRDMSEGLAEVFCISDPSRPDNPIVFASEEFHRTTQYGPDYVLGRNCRFLQGPKTNPFAVQRIREMLKQGKEHYETFLNYRRDGLPFMNLLMCTPLFDSKGQVRYHLGAQVDVSGLAKDCSGLESLRRLVDRDDEEERANDGDDDYYYVNGTRQRRDSGTDFNDIPGGGNHIPVGTATTTPHARAPRVNDGPKDEFRQLAEMFNRAELDTVRRFGGRMHRSQQEQIQHVEAVNAANWHKPRVVLHDSSPPDTPPVSPPNSTNASHQQRKVIGSDDRTDANGNISVSARPRSPAGVLISSPPLQPSNGAGNNNDNNNIPRAPAIFENYLIVRPYPSLRILFASRSLRVPGILQSHLMSRIGGSRRIHDELEQAFAAGQSVTAKVKWISGSDLRNANAAQQFTAAYHYQGANNHNDNGVMGDNHSGASTASLHQNGYSGGIGQRGHNTTPRYDTVGMEGRPRWIHCTPLTSTTGAVGVWVVVIVDEEGSSEASERAARRRQDFSTGNTPYTANNSSNATNSPQSNNGTTGARQQQQQRRQQQQRQQTPWDEMTLTDFASMNRLPEDEDLRQHFREMYVETKRRERGGNGARVSSDITRPGSRAAMKDQNNIVVAGRGDVRSRFDGGNGMGGGQTGRSSTPGVGAGGGRSGTPDLMGHGGRM